MVNLGLFIRFTSYQSKIFTKFPAVLILKFRPNSHLKDIQNLRKFCNIFFLLLICCRNTFSGHKNPLKTIGNGIRFRTPDLQKHHIKQELSWKSQNTGPVLRCLCHTNKVIFSKNNSCCTCWIPWCFKFMNSCMSKWNYLNTWAV